MKMNLILMVYFGPGVRKILIRDVKTDGINYKMEYIHNLDDLHLQLNSDRIFLKLYLDDNTYIFRKYPDLESINFFKNTQKVESIEIVIGDVTSHKYTLGESDLNQTFSINNENSLTPSPF